MEPEVLVLSVTCQGTTMRDLLEKFEAEVGSFVGSENVVVSLTQNGTVERGLSDEGRVFRGTRVYEVTVVREEPDAPPAEEESEDGGVVADDTEPLAEDQTA